MNLVFGATSDREFERAEQWVSQRYGRELREVAGSALNVRVGTLSNSSMVASASTGGNTCILLGRIHFPVPEWMSRSGVDRSDGVAQEILDHYIATGSLGVQQLIGQFAVCLLTPEAVVLGTDAGMRTWFYDEAVDRFAFSSNLRLLAQTRDKIEIDRTHEDFFLINGYHPPHATPYVSLRSLPGRSQVAYDGASLREIPDDSPPTPLQIPSPPSSESEAIDTLYDVFMSSIEDQVSTEQRAGVLLGGFDSALVAAGLARLGKDVETYSFSYEDPAYNQPFAQEVADAISGRHHWIQIDGDTVANGLLSYTDYFNRPTNWPNYVISTAQVCLRMVDDGIEQCFSGDGCDSIFLGYPGTARRARVIRALNRIPGSAHRVLLKAAGRPWLDRNVGHPHRVVLGLLRGSQREEPSRTYLSFRILDEISVAQLRSGEKVNEEAVSALGEELAKPHSGLSSYRLAYEGKSAVSPNKNKMIGSADGSGLTIWSPYMHPRLKTFALSLPDTLMRPNHKTDSAITGKYILQRMAVAKGLLSEDIVFQPKVAAVDAPIDDWYAGQLRSTVLSLYKSLPFSVDWEYAERLMEPSFAERAFRDRVMVDKVITHAASLLATYGAFGEAVKHVETQLHS